MDSIEENQNVFPPNIAKDAVEGNDLCLQFIFFIFC